MSYTEAEEPAPPRQAMLSECPECDRELAVLRVIAGRTGCEYWTMRCTHCGSIHLDIRKPRPSPDEGGRQPPL
jgi:uncharacterized Zn finger protein